MLLWITVGMLAIFWVIAVWMHLTGGFVTYALGVCLFITIVVRLLLPRRRRSSELPPGQKSALGTLDSTSATPAKKG